jgi:cysteine-rich repeat protein
MAVLWPSFGCDPTCGDGILAAPAEACDDGNVTSGDGCTASCLVEPGWTCSGSPSLCTPL